MTATADLHRSWGGLAGRDSRVVDARDWVERPERFRQPLLPYGMGRSYGDSCLVSDGTLLDTSRFDKVLAFDRDTGIVTCEPGLTFEKLLEIVVPAGWFPPVTPGTACVTMGGALANDVHGKNHHAAGTFGHHVRSFELMRADGSRLFCAPELHPALFAATIGGYGLTGLVTQITLQLRPIGSALMEQETLPFTGLDRFFEIAAQSDSRFDYTVAWIDSLADGRNFGRGLFFRANHAQAPGPLGTTAPGKLSMPFQPPFSLINRATLSLFNRAYRLGQARPGARHAVPYRPFFYPLDGIRHWNRAYGPKGLRQFQCALPMAAARDAVDSLLRLTLRAGEASFLTVLKLFGDKPSPGLMSFPIPGATLTLDFPYRGQRTDRLLADLDAVVLEAGGRVNPYKDARMPAETFRRSFPQWRDFAAQCDPGFTSDFWRRVSRD